MSYAKSSIDIAGHNVGRTCLPDESWSQSEYLDQISPLNKATGMVLFSDEAATEA
jgi:hypothetical protein